MKSVLGVGLGGMVLVILAQACGSSDESKNNPPVAYPEGGAAGADPGGAPTSGTSGSAGTAGSSGAVGEGGSAGTTDAGGAAGSATSGGEGGVNTSGAGGLGGAAGEGASSGEGGTGEGGTGGASDDITCEVAPTCTQSLANVGTGDFSISFKVTTTAQTLSGLVSQRQICMRSKFWDVRLRAGTTGISVETDDQANYTSFVAPMVLNDGAPHEVRICRKAGMLYAFADGTLRAQKASVSNLATLPAFQSKTTVCTATDGTAALVGTLEDVCVGALP